MSFSMTNLADFMEFFTGNKSAYGQFAPDPSNTKTKQTGKCFTVNKPITEEAYEEHLRGHTGLGVVPIDETGSCSFGVIDIDKYDNTTAGVLHSVQELTLPLVPFRSKSGGVHLYIFFSQPAPAARVISVMRTFVRLLKLGEKTEVFPKQKEKKEGGIGNWINLPYFNGTETRRFLITGNSPNEAPSLTFDEALLHIRARRTTIGAIEEFIEGLPLNDAPPCIQAIYLSHDTTYRNNYLFSLARYFKAKHGDDFEKYVLEANNELAEPVPLGELVNTIIKSHKTKDYAYKCDDQPICELCDKNLCKKRQYGVGGDYISQLSFEDFIQVKSDQPYYIWKINGQELKFYDEDSIINQKKFREQAMRLLHVLPNKLSEPAWVNIVNNALTNVIVKTIDKADDISDGGMLMKYLAEFLEDRVQAQQRSQVLMKKVFKDHEKSRYMFKSEAFVEFLNEQKQFRAFTKTEIMERLHAVGAENVRAYVDPKNTSCRVMLVPFTAIVDYLDDKSIVTHPQADAEDKVEYDENDF